MSIGVSRALIAAACLGGLAGCSNTGLLGSATAPEPTTASIVDSSGKPLDAADLKGRPFVTPSETTATIPVAPRVEPEPAPLGPWSAAEDPNDDLALGKRQYREGNYGLAEKYFRKV